jgi:urea transporter
MGLDSTAAIAAGLWGFVPSLTAIALCGLFFALTPTTVLLSVMGILFSVLLSVPLRMGGGVIGLPVFSFPFIVTTWLFLGAQGSIKHAPAVDLTEISTPERHFVDLWREEKEKKKMET